MDASPPTSRTTAPTRLRLVVTWLLRVALSAVFLGAGLSKLFGDPAMVDMFAVIGAGQWLRYFVGACELAGAIGIVIPRTSALAAAGLALLMIGASISNMVSLDTSPMLTIVIFLAAALAAWLGLRRTGVPSGLHRT